MNHAANREERIVDDALSGVWDTVRASNGTLLYRRMTAGEVSVIKSQDKDEWAWEAFVYALPAHERTSKAHGFESSERKAKQRGLMVYLAMVREVVT